MEQKNNNLPKIQFIKQPENFGSNIVGEVYRQMGPFQWHEHDWNNDGDTYEEKVAKFQKVSDVNPHSVNYLTLFEWEFRDLKNEGYIAYVKEQTISDKTRPSLDAMMTSASARVAQQARQAVDKQDKQKTLNEPTR